MMTAALQALPRLGVGLGFRDELAEATVANRAEIDWLEVICDNFIRRTPAVRAQATSLRETFPLVPHGLEMSVGSQAPLNESYVQDVVEFAAFLDAPWFSDHLCFTREGGLDTGTLLPLDRTRRAAAEIARRAQHVQEAAGRPFLLENITYYVDIESELDEPAFITAVLDDCDCGLLLDVTNLWINSVNHRFDPRSFLDAIPVERVVQVHLAGGFLDADGNVIDSHSYPVPDEVWRLLADLNGRTALKGVMIERDDNFPDDFGDIVGELRIARSVLGWDRSLVGG